MKKFALTLCLFLLMAGCVPSAPTAEPSPPAAAMPTLADGPLSVAPEPASSSCISTEPTQADIDAALNFPDGLFDNADWSKSYAVSESRVAVTWTSDPLGAVVYIESLIFPCGYEEPDLDDYFNAEYWDIIFENYQSYEQSAACQNNDGLRLHEFNTSFEDNRYDTRYWIMNDTDTRVITAMLVFPADSADLMAEYSSSLFPDLTTCP